MTCIKFSGGIFCVGRKNIRLRLLDGSYVYMEWHSYAGPIFYKDKDGKRVIDKWWENDLLVHIQDWFINRGKVA